MTIKQVLPPPERRAFGQSRRKQVRRQEQKRWSSSDRQTDLIDALATSGLNVNLAVSLHAPDDPTRARLLPSGRRFGVKEILAAADRYQGATGRPVSIQYCLLKGVNDSMDQADALARLLVGRRMHVNLLRYNPTGMSLRGETYAASPEAATEAFTSRLTKRGVVVHVRRSRGTDIDAACGQLRRGASPGAASALP